MSNKSNTSFTATAAHTRALDLAKKVAASSSKTLPCHVCKGSGIQVLRVETIGDPTPPQASYILCSGCRNTPGTQDAVHQHYTHHIWCACKHPKGFLHAPDGREANFVRRCSGLLQRKRRRKVFGNTTYLCATCGFVRQFG